MEFLKENHEVLFCFVIFFTELIEMSLSSVKTTLVVKGSRVRSTVTAFFEILIWAILISNIISELGTNYYWLLAYCLGYALGYYVGAIIESKIAMGTVDAQFIFPENYNEAVELMLTNEQVGFYFCEIRGSTAGIQTKCHCILPRKKAKEVRHMMEAICEGKVFSVNSDVVYKKGGYGLKK